MGQCGSSKDVKGDGTLTAEDIANVRDTWKVAYAGWNKYGVQYFIRLFELDVDIKKAFKSLSHLSNEELKTNPDLEAHVMVFGAGVTGFVDNLDNTDKLIPLIHNMTDNHLDRGITLKYFREALPELLNFLGETLKPTIEEVSAWKKVIAILDKVISDRIKSKEG